MASDINDRIKIIEKLDSNLLISASAGSGKTTILVERMVALVEANKFPLSKIAALTFTKKAAGEFYERFYKKLQIRTKPDFDYHRDDPHSLLGNPSKEAIQRDKEALKHIDTCFFGTIDAFYQKILNEHPLEAGLSSSSTIIDDETFNLYLIKKFSEYLKSNDPVIREKTEFFSTICGASEFPSMMSMVLSNVNRELYQIPDNITEIEKLYKDQFEKFKIGVKILAENENVFRHVKEGKDGVMSDSNAGSKNAWEYLLSSTNYISSLKYTDYVGVGKAFKKLENLRMFDDNKGLLAKCDFISLFTEELVLRNKPDGRVIKSSCLELLDKIKFYRVVDFLQYVKNDIYSSMISSGLLTFSLATDCLLKLLRNDSEYKSTIINIRNNIGCLLIDECQDTDMNQYEIFFRLTASNFPKDFKDCEIEGGKLYACGDRKQGIYHFRGADVSTYDYIKQIFEGNRKQGLNFDLVTLTDNHRSKGNLLHYFNNTFENMLSSQGYSPILNAPSSYDEKYYGTYSYFTSKSTDPSNVALIILQLCKQYGYTFKNFMVMTSSKDSIMNYSKEFSKLSIPCYCEGKIDIHVSPLLDAIISLFKYVGSNKKDLISYLEVLSSPLFNFDIKKGIDISDSYFDKFNLHISKTHWPSDLLELLAENPYVIKILNCKGLDVLYGFIHLLKEQENAGLVNNYDDAIKYFEKLQSGEVSIERLSLLANDINAVQIANAHKTKGLEKEVVILTCAGEANTSPKTVVADKFYNLSFGENRKGNSINNPYIKVSPVSDLKEQEKNYESEEKKRLLYVAGTRAKEMLFVAVSLDKTGKPSKSKWGELLCCEKEIKHLEIYNNDYSDFKPEKEVYTNKPINTFVNKHKEFSLVAPSKEETPRIYDDNYKESILSREDSLVFGTMVHKLMEYIIKNKNIVLDDSICDLICYLYNNYDFKDKLLSIKETIYSGGFEQTDNLYKDILSIAKQSDTYTEVAFSYKDNEDIVNGFIDLAIVQNDKVLIVDYKTDSNEIDHSAQLEYYKKAVIKSNIYNGKEIIPYIYNIKK